MDLSELLIWIGIGVLFLIVIIVSLLFSVNEWSSAFQNWLFRKKDK